MNGGDLLAGCNPIAALPEAQAERRCLPARASLAYGILWWLIWAFLPSPSAGGLMELDVSESGGVYRVNVLAIVDAPAQYVKAVLKDYKHTYRLNPSIVESEILPAPALGVSRVRVVVRGCVAFFCKDVGRVEDIRELTSDDFQAVVVPELSNLRSGTAVWNVRETGLQTRVRYQAYIEPDFFVPPLIGTYFVKRKLREELKISFSRLECVAQTEARRDTRPRLRLVSLENVRGSCELQ
jgi:hypothetical protein